MSNLLPLILVNLREFLGRNQALQNVGPERVNNELENAYI